MHADGTDRLHALDAVRAGALILGVMFHGMASYIPGPSVWVITDGAESRLLSVAYFVLHTFRMSLFFIVAGFFGRMLLERRGPRGFIRDRLKRIGIPLLAFWPLAVGGALGAFMLWRTMIHSPAPIPPLPHAPLAFPLMHLWFLYLLLWMYAFALAGRALIGRLDRVGRLKSAADGLLSFLVTNPLGLAPLIAPFLVAVWFAPEWFMWFGVPRADLALFINVPAQAAYGSAFLFGWLLQRQMHLLKTLERRWPLYLAASVGLTALCLAITGVKPVLTAAVHDLETLVFAIALSVSIWTWNFGLIGLAMRYLSDPDPVRRYLADASYWIYLVHVPILLLLQALFARTHWAWWVEYPAILAISFAIMLGTYEVMVRPSWLGELLNGRRIPREAPRSSRGATSAASSDSRKGPRVTARS